MVSILILRKVFDGASGKLVLSKGRALNHLEERRIKITIRTQELKEKRRKDFDIYKKRYESALKGPNEVKQRPCAA